MVDDFIWAKTPYDLIQQWWGESLSTELAQRMVNAPLKQLCLFQDAYWARGERSFPVPELASGHLRPSLRFGLMDALAARDGPPFDVAVKLLLYSHEVLLDDPLSSLGFDDRHHLRRSLDVLLKLQPLAELGIVHLVHIASRARHPSKVRNYDAVERRIQDTDMSGFQELLVHARRIGIDSIEDLMLQVLLETMGSVRLARSFRGKVQPLARSEAESVALQAILEDAAASTPDLRNMHLRKLAGMAVPSLSPKISELVAVRRSNEDFAAWRDALTVALSQIEQIKEEDERWVAQASSIVDAELEAVRERVNAAVKRSPALESLRVGTAGFALAGLGALVGAAAGGGKVLPALAGAGSAKAIEGAVNYMHMLRDRRQGRALLGLALSFRDQGSR
jgi:hypothetical protein